MITTQTSPQAGEQQEPAKLRNTLLEQNSSRAAWDGPRAALAAGASVSHHAQGGGIWPDGLACPTPSRKRPTNQPGTRAGPWSAVLIDGRPRWLHRLPVGVSRHATVPPSPGSKGRTDRPARQQKGAGMRQFEQDWLELGRRVASSLHYQHPRNLRLLQAAKTEPRLATASTTRATHSSP